MLLILSVEVRGRGERDTESNGAQLLLLVCLILIEHFTFVGGGGVFLLRPINLFVGVRGESHIERSLGLRRGAINVSDS